jgi:glycosyltransferase involved in cell wall biosynthesis
MDTLYIVVPCYNEQEVLPETAKRLREKLSGLIAAKKVSDKSRIVFVNDGSKDKTWEIINSLHKSDRLFSGICLSRNCGHQHALLAGLMTVKDEADMVISMDADLQDDINAVDEMIEKYYSGCDIVYGVRSKRALDTFFKRFSAQCFYKLMKALGVKTIYNHADYRLLSRRALDPLSRFGEVNLFLRGIVPLLGFKSDIVTYERQERFAGESKYPLKKMISFAIDGITSFSIKPIRIITGLGLFIFIACIFIFAYILIRYLTGHTVAGWTSIVTSLWAIGGLVLLSLGVIGEYIGKTYMEVKQRPRFIVEQYLSDKPENCSK